MTRLPEQFLRRPLAHRALHDVKDGRPENSRAAISAAIAAGYGIEIDVQLSADNQAMVFHDYHLQRLTGANGPVRMRSHADLKAVNLTGGSEGIPDLHDVLDLVASRVPVLIEIKDQDGAMGANVGELERAVANALASYNGPVAVMSFNPHSVGVMKDLLPDVPRGLTTSSYAPDEWNLLPVDVCDRLRDIPDYDRVGACFISHQAPDLARPRVAKLRTAGAAILCWTIRDKVAEVQARSVAQNITFEGYLPDIPIR